MSEIKFPEISNSANGMQNANGDAAANTGERAKSYQSSRTGNNQLVASQGQEKSAFIAKKERQE